MVLRLYINLTFMNNSFAYRLLWNRRTRNLILTLLRFFCIKRGRVMCVCWGGNKYNCNPKAITDTLMRSSNAKEFEVFFAFQNHCYYKDVLTDGIKCVQIGSLEYFYKLATSQFVIANTRITGILWPMPKKKGQYYIQTQHGGHGIKRVEFDVKETLSPSYVQSAIIDTERTDLMLSDSKYWTNVYRKAYHYRGEVLEHGLPRNDIFFADDDIKRNLKKNLLQFIKTHSNEKYSDELRFSKFLIYTPTFRNNCQKDVYGFDVDRVVEALEAKFGGMWYILVSSHPNMLGYYKEIYDFSHPRLIDIGMYPELQELLVVSDVLITDYSSAEMDFSLTERPVFQLCKDISNYDRGFYIHPIELPFPYAENTETLCDNILNFNETEYINNLNKFNSSVIGLAETGCASQYVVNWLINKV